MKSIRNIAFSALLTIGAFTAITYTACNKDECKDVVCQNGGTCADGVCTCPTGYEGTLCETEVRAKFLKSQAIGTWAASDKKVSDNSTFTYSATIGKGTGITEILIGDFSKAFFDNDVKATVNSNTVTIPKQQPDNDGYYVQGTGTYNADKTITWTYTLTSPVSGDQSYTGTWQ